MASTSASRARFVVSAATVMATVLVLSSAGRAAAQSAPPAEAQAAAPAPSKLEITVSASATVVSAYVWRGWIIADEACVQPLVSVKAGGLTLTSWVNFWPGNEGDTFTEHDFTLDYTRSVGRVDLSAGYINYFFASLETGRWTNELYVGAALSGPLTPTVRVYQDVQEGSGTYVSLGVSHSVELGSKGFSATPSAVLGYNKDQWIDGSGWSDLAMGVAFALPLNKHLDASASANYSLSLNKDWFPSKFWGGFTLAVH